MRNKDVAADAKDSHDKSPIGRVQPRMRQDWSGYIVGVCTLALVGMGFLQWRTLESQAGIQALQSKILESQTEVQRLTSQANIAPSYDGKRDDGKLILRFENTGLLPALQVTIWGRSGLRSPMSDTELVAFCAEPEAIAKPLTVHPGASIEHHVAYPRFSEAAEVGDEIYYACGAAAYSDAFGKIRQSSFCLSFDRGEITKEYGHTICTLPGSDAAIDG